MLPADVSATGAWVDRVIYLAVGGGIVVGIIAFAVLIGMLVVYHHRRKKDPEYTLPGWAKKVVFIDYMMLVFDFLLLVLSTYAWAKIAIQSTDEIRAVAQKEGKPVVEVEVIGRQFFWAFRYPGLDGKFNTGDDFTLADELVVPNDAYVILHITAGDTLHSFFAPHFRVKYDAIPGRTTRVWFVTQQEGEYEVACAELCGSYHYRMRAVIKVVSPEEYKAFLQRRAYGGA